MAELVKKENNLVELKFTISSEDFKKAIDQAFTKTRGKYNIPGFRKGKASRKVIENYYGEGVFYNDALNQCIPDIYDAAVEELGLFPVDQPDIDIKHIEIGKDIEVEAKVYVKPEFEMPQYKNLKSEAVIKDVTDEDVLEELKKEQKKNARMVVVEGRAAEMGDTAVIDFKGFMDDVAFEGGEAENHALILGSNAFIPGFEDQIVGKSVGESFDVNVTFPEEYQAEELAGKLAKFEVKLNEIKVEELPELDDDFASDTSEFDTLEEYKSDIRKNLEEQRQKDYEIEFKASLVEQISKTAEIDIPKPMVESEIDVMIGDFDYQLQSQGLSLEQYIQFSGLQIDDFREKIKDDAFNRVKTELVLNKLIEIEHLEATEEELEKELQDIAERQKLELDKVKSVYARNDYAAIKNAIQTKKAIDFLVDNSEK